MANEIITKYLSDTTVPAEKRRNIAQQLNSGAMTPDVAIKGITTKYGTKYGSAESGSSDAAGAIGGAAKSVLGALTGGSAGDLATSAIKAAAPGIVKVGAAAQSTGILPSPPSTEEQMKADQAKQATVEEEKAVAQGLNKLGITPPAEWTLDEKKQALDEISKRQKANIMGPVGGIVDAVVPAVYKSTLEPVGQFGAGVAGTSFAGMKGALAQINELLKSGDLTKAQQLAEKAMTEPVNFAGSNINWFKSDETGQLDRGQSALKIGAEGVRGAAGVINTATLAGGSLGASVGANAFAGGGLSFGDAIREGKNPFEVALETGTGAIMQGGLTWLANKIGGPKAKPEDFATNKLLKEGVKEQYVNQLGSLDDAQKQVAADYLDAGLTKLADSNADDVYRYASKESGLDDFMRQMDDMKKTLGGSVSEAKAGLANVNVSDDVLRQNASQMDDLFKRYNIKQNPINIQAEQGKFNFSNSDLAGVPKATQDKITNLFDTLKSGKGVNARDLESITSQIDQATGVLKTSGIKSSDPAVQALTDVKRIVNKVLTETDQGFSAANTQYADFIKAYKQIKEAGTVKLASGKTAFNGSQILKRSLTTGDMRYKEAIQVMDDVAKKYGLTPPKDLQLRARLAEMAESFTGTQQPRSLAGEVGKQAERVIEGVPKVGAVVKAGKAIKQAVSKEGYRPLQEQTAKVKDILLKSIQKADKAGKSTVSLPREAASQFLKIAKLVIAGS